MALYIPTTFGASGNATIIASGSTSISGTIGMNGGWPLQQDYFVSNSVTYSYWMWQAVFPNDATTGSNQNRTTNIATFDILSGSSFNARLLLIGGGGGLGGGQAIYEPLNGWVGGGLALGGGAAGGVVEFNNFPLLQGHYNIVAGAGGDGISGISSSITIPLPIAQPFTSSYVVAYGGGRGGYADRTTNSKGLSGGSVGGNTQRDGITTPVASNPVLGAGLSGRDGGDQGRVSGDIPASSPTAQFSFTATGGGGVNGSSLSVVAGRSVTNGGSGSLINIYPYNYNTASIVATGGGAAGLPGNTGTISQSWSYSSPGNNGWGIGSGCSVSASIENDGANYGIVYLEYPYNFYPYSQLATNGLVFRLSQTSLTGSIWYDESGNGNNALLSGSTLYTTGSGGSLGWKFNGINNYINFPVSMSGYPVSQSYSLQWYGTKMNNGDVWYHYSGSGTLSRGDGFGAYNGDVNDWINYQQADQKTLYTFVYTNFGGIGGNVGWSKLYINDSIFWVEYDQSTFFQSQPTSAPNIPWQFGYTTSTGDFGTSTRVYLNGSASDLLLYNRPLDVTEIANNYRYLQTLPLVNNPDPFASTSIDYLIVGGGAGGGSDVSIAGKAYGGGGAGQFISGSTILSRYTTWPVTIGGGGAVNTNGTSSTFLSLTSIGGGGGNLTTGSNGACGGGGSALSGSPSIQTPYAGGIGSNGMNGASGSLDTNFKASAGGGGGTLTDGSIGTVLVGGAGGSGTLWLDGKYYSAGGGGGYSRGSGATEGAGGAGGNSIGGTGACLRGGTTLATTGSANRGAGGGGGAGTSPGAAGGSGVNIIRYAGSGSRATGGTITYSGSYTYHTFTSNGSFSLI